VNVESSSPANVRVSLVELVVPLGAPDSDGVDGAEVSTVQLAERVMLLPAVSVDLMTTEWLPSVKPVRERGEVQAVYAPPSIEQVIVESSSPENVSVALVELVVPLGAPDSDGVDGAEVSTVQLAERVVVLPAASVDLIEIEWAPSERPVSERGEAQAV